MSETEFEAHMKEVFFPMHYHDGEFVWSKEALIDGLYSISFNSIECEAIMMETPKQAIPINFIINNIRQMQAVASMLSIALEKYEFTDG